MESSKLYEVYNDGVFIVYISFVYETNLFLHCDVIGKINSRRLYELNDFLYELFLFYHSIGIDLAYMVTPSPHFAELVFDDYLIDLGKVDGYDMFAVNLKEYIDGY